MRQVTSPYQSTLACQEATNFSQYYRRGALSMGSGMFRCIMCENIFTQKLALMNHMRSSHLGNDQEEDFLEEVKGEGAEVQVKGKTIHKCAKCGERYRKLRTLNLHMKEDHPDAGENTDEQKPVQQTDAQVRKIEKKEVGQENDEEVTVSEKDCEENPMDHIVDVEQYDSKGDHEDVEKEDGETLIKDFKNEHKRFVCDDCGKDFVHKRTLREHHVKFHPQNVRIQEFRGALDWIAYRTESESGKPKCVQCGKEFPSVSNLKVHVRYVHIKNVLATCIECGKELSCMKSLKIHVRNVHRDPPVHLAEKKYRGHSDWKPYRTESEDGKPKCKTCGKEYSSVRSLKDHVKYVHLLKEPRIRPQEPVDERICIVCKKTFEKTINMKLHIVKHTKAYKSLNIEQQISISEDRRSAYCLECGKWDGRAKNIKQHISQVHYQLHKTIDFNNRDNFDFSEG